MEGSEVSLGLDTDRANDSIPWHCKRSQKADAFIAEKDLVCSRRGNARVLVVLPCFLGVFRAFSRSDLSVFWMDIAFSSRVS